MPQSIHLICRRDVDGYLNGLKLLTRPDIFRSVAWELSQTEATALVGGWVYLHPSKSQTSEFGGKILRIEDAGSCTVHGRPEIALIVESRLEGKGQRWRGATHGMAWSGGLVPTTLPHESETKDA